MSHHSHPLRIRFIPTANALTTIRGSFKALREGVATEGQWNSLAAMIAVALSIGDKGTVRGLRGHFEAAETALTSVKLRALAAGQWVPTALRYDELDAITNGVDLHEFQLYQVKKHEAIAAPTLRTSRFSGNTGRALTVRENTQGAYA